MNCHYHPNNLLDSFCTSSTCHLPLCQECIIRHSDEHLYFHSFPEIRSLETCLQETLHGIDKVQEGLFTCLKESHKIMKENYDGSIKAVEKEEERVLCLIKKFFASVKSELSYNSELRKTLLEKEISKFLSRAECRSSKLDKLRVKLLTKESSIKYLIKARMKGVLQLYSKEVGSFEEYLLNIKKSEPKVFVNGALLEAMNEEMNNVVEKSNESLKSLISTGDRKFEEFANSLEVSENEEEISIPMKTELEVANIIESPIKPLQDTISPRKSFKENLPTAPFKVERMRSLQRNSRFRSQTLPKNQQQVSPTRRFFANQTPNQIFYQLMPVHYNQCSPNTSIQLQKQKYATDNTFLFNSKIYESQFITQKNMQLTNSTDHVRLSKNNLDLLERKN